MIERVALIAPTSPPLTGVSRQRTPFWPSAAATLTAAVGAMELMSAYSIPARTPSIKPPGPSATASTSGESGSIVMSTSLRSATSFGEAAADVPASTATATAWRTTSWTTNA